MATIDNKSEIIDFSELKLRGEQVTWDSPSVEIVVQSLQKVGIPLEDVLVDGYESGGAEFLLRRESKLWKNVEPWES